MLRTNLCSLASFIAPIVAGALILPPVAVASPDAPVASETLVTSDSPPPPTPPAQSQQQGGLSQSLTPDSQGQSMRFDPGNAPVYHGPGITMQPQIQVQVQPQIQVTAQPHAEANPNSTSSADAKGDVRNNANANADADADSQSQSQSNAESDIKVKQGASSSPAPTVATTTRTTPTRIRVKTTVIPGKPQTVHPIYPYKPPKRRKGLMIAGWTIFGSSYLPTALTGAQVYDWCSNNRTGAARSDCRELGQFLMIPAVGPFLAIDKVDNATEGYFLALTGAVQSAGLLMGIIGTGQYIRDGKRNERINAQGVRVAKGLRVGAGSLHLSF